MTQVDKCQPLVLWNHFSHTVWEDEHEKIVHPQISSKRLFEEIIHSQISLKYLFQEIVSSQISSKHLFEKTF